MADDNEDIIDPADSLIIKRHFGVNWRWWKKFRKQWTPTSIITVLGTLLTTGGWALRQSTRVTVLETRVIPVLEERKQESENKVRVQDLQYRVGRIERVLDVDYAEKWVTWAEQVRAARAAGKPLPPPPDQKGPTKR